MSSGSPTPTTQTTTYQLSPEQQQLMNLAMPGVTKFAASVPQQYQGEQVSPFTAPQVAGQEQALTAAGGQTALGQAGAGATMDWLRPGATDVSQRPDVQAAIKTATDPIMEALTRQGLPAIRSSAEQTGNFGSSRQGIAEGLAEEGASKAIGKATSDITSDAYKTAVDAQLKSLGLLPSTEGALTTGAYTTSNVGDVQRAMEQAKIDEAVQRFNYGEYAPFLQSQDIMSLLAGIPGGSVTTTGTTPAKNPLTSGLGGAAAGASLGATLGSVVPGLGTGVGALAGAGIGGLLPFIS
jgi:hypothetical protein